MILLLSALLAVEVIDLEMTPQDKKKTGVFKLRDQEKATLQAWIDSRYEKREVALEQKPVPAKKPSVSEIFYSGKYVRLSDGSLWNVRPQDTPLTQSWISSADIIITPSQDATYPYKLTNTITGSSVFAKKATELPATNPL